MSENLEKNEDKKEEKALVSKEEKKSKKEKKKLEKSAKSMDSKIIICIVVAVILVALSIFGYFLYNKSFKAVAKYDGGYVSASDFEIYYRTFAPMLQYSGYSGDLIPEIIAEKAASDKMITERAKKAGINIDAEDKAYVDEIFADEEQIKTFTEAGIDVVRMKQFYYNDYIMDDYIEYLKENLSDEEVKAHIVEENGENADMREYVTSHILFLTMDTTTYESYSEEKKQEIRAKAEEVLKLALAGGDFSDLVKEYSEDGSKDSGGVYKVYMDNNTVSEYVNAAVSLNLGEIYPQLVESAYGYHIIKLNEYNEQGRVHSDFEREEIVKEKLNNITTELNFKIENDVLNETVKKITGESSNDSSNNSSNEGSGEDSNSTEESSNPENNSETTN